MPGQKDSDRKNERNIQTMVPAVEHAARILHYFTTLDGGNANLTEICQALGLYKSRGHAILKTMAAYGLVERNEATKRYSLGPALVPLSRKFLKHLDIREKAFPILETLARKTGGTALLGITSEEHLIVIAKRDGDTRLGITIEIGHRFHVTAGAHGKAIVSFLSDEMYKKIMKGKTLLTLNILCMAHRILLVWMWMMLEPNKRPSKKEWYLPANRGYIFPKKKLESESKLILLWMMFP